MFTNNKQKTKLTLKLVREWDFFSHKKKIVDKVKKPDLKYFHMCHLTFLQTNENSISFQQEETSQSQKFLHITIPCRPKADSQSLEFAEFPLPDLQTQI